MNSSCEGSSYFLQFNTSFQINYLATKIHLIEEILKRVEKEKKIAEDFLGFPNFKASDDWLTRFKIRHSILSKVWSSESASVKNNKANECKQQISDVARGFKPDYILYVDEMGFFFTNVC